jgi:hypothetical protein
VPAARALAHRYDDHLAAARAARAFDRWLDGFWCPAGPPEPAGLPGATSAVGNGQVIRWFVVGGVVRGYVPDFPGGCYEVPLAALAACDARAEDRVLAVAVRAPGEPGLPRD